MILLYLMIGFYLLGALVALFQPGPSSRKLANLAPAAAAASGIAFAFPVLLSGAPVSFEIPASLALLTFSFRLDPLGAFFLIVIGVGAIPASIYAIGHIRHEGEESPRRAQECMLNLFLMTMSLVAMADNVVTFLICWEAMSISSYLLVISENQSSETLSAGSWYAGMAHAGFGLIAASLLLAAAGTRSMSFAEIRGLGLAPDLKDAVFLLALLGFGSKAGLVPLHVWLPRAHPAAPSHVSALMSGVMVKLGIYGLVRVSLDLLGGGPPWWGGLVLSIGVISALLGVLYALMQHDLKRLLAYHTVENLGIISMGVGLALIFRSHGLAALAAIALTAALFHTLNHAAFKGLLFLGAGSVLHATGTPNMEEMGGLIRGMPVTAACFLVGAAAISGLPPLNGFASEWMLFQSLLAGIWIPHSFATAMLALTIGMLALTAGLAAACFVKAFGISFLAIPRSDPARNAREVPGAMRFGMMFLAAVCILLGILPSLVVPFLSRAAGRMRGIDAAGVTFQLALPVDFGSQSSQISPLVLALLLIGVIAAIPLLLRLLRVRGGIRSAESWGCGRIVQTARMEYTGTAFAEPLRRVFGDLYRPTRDITVGVLPESRYFVQSIQYRSQVRSWFDEFLFTPLDRAVQRLGGMSRWLQSGSVHWYIAYLFLALVLLLLISRWI